MFTYDSFPLHTAIFISLLCFSEDSHSANDSAITELCYCFSGDFSSANDSAIIQLEQDVLRPLAGTGKAFVYQTTNWWSQLKSAGSAIYANRHCLQLYKKLHPERLTGLGIQDRKSKQIPKIIGDVFIHPTAYVHHTAVVS